MKVTMGVRYFEPKGGAEKFSMALAEFLRDRGHTVRVFALSGEPKPGVELILLSPPKFMPRFCRDWMTGRVLSRALDQVTDGVTWGEQKVWHADVIRPGGGSEREYWRVHAKFDPLGQWVGSWLQYLTPKRVFDLHAERRSMTSPRLKALITNSRYTGGHLTRDFPEVATKLSVVHNGTEPAAPPLPSRSALRARMGLPVDAVTVLFIGHGFRRKGLDPALRAFALAAESRPGLRFLVAGRDRSSPFERLAHRLGIGDRVIFSGETYSARELYTASDLLLFPSYFDPFANVTVEALGYGLPVITTRTNGGHEVLHHGVDGWVVDDADQFEALAEGLLHLVDPAHLPAAQQAARATAGQNTLTGALEKVEQILLSVESSSHSERVTR